MKGAVFQAALVLFAALPGRFQSCDEESSPCPAPDIAAHPENYPELCGDGVTKPRCTSLEPKLPLVLRRLEKLAEVSSYLKEPPAALDERCRYWTLEMLDADAMRSWILPSRFGVPMVLPFARLRSDSRNPAVGLSAMSAYFCSSDIRAGCIVDLVTTMSWTLQGTQDKVFAHDFVYATNVIAARGDCPAGSADSKAGDLWTGSGTLYRPSGCIEETPPCTEDAWCDYWCDSDPDCPCRTNGVCEEDCPEDSDCLCLEDGYCDPECLSRGKLDPDCDCSRDGVCNELCRRSDPDCGCGLDNECNPECESIDPDCSCEEDGRCNPLCPGTDPDCRCAADGRCDPDCLEEDPDCGCGKDGACMPICGWLDPDCQCLEDGICSTCDCIDPDCPVEGPD